MTSYMNDYDLSYARSRFTRASTPNRLGLVIVVERLAEWTNENSDGWAYWSKPLQAAQRAISHIESTTSRENEQQERDDISDAELAAAVRPIKSFLTRQGVSVERKNLILRSSEPLFNVVGEMRF